MQRRRVRDQIARATRLPAAIPCASGAGGSRRLTGGRSGFGHAFRCRRGAVSVEAALIFPVLILLVMGMIEFALLFFTFSTLQSATRDIARQVSVNFAQANSASAESAVQAQMPGWSKNSVAVIVTESAPLDPSSNVITVRSALPASGATPLNFLVNTIGDWDLVTEVQMKQELPFSVPEP